VGYKGQVAETVGEVTLAPGEPTRNFIVGIVTHPACQSDEAGAVLMEDEPAAMGLEKPPGQYVDGAYISAQKLVEARAAGRELSGPVPAAMPAPGRSAPSPLPGRKRPHPVPPTGGNGHGQSQLSL
jgi:hypothetical protein